ncbi:alpha-2-macroglobulin family protein [Pseudomonas sp. HK3]
MNHLRRISALAIMLVLFQGCSNDTNESDTASLNNTDKSAASTLEPNKADNAQASHPESTASQTVADPTFNLEKIKTSYENVVFSVSDISERTYDGGNSLAVTFSVPINPADNFAKYLSVKGENGLINSSWVLSDSGKIAYFEAISPNTKYTVSVDWHLTSALGQSLKNDESETITTRNVQDTISFSSTGHFLPLDLHTGLPVTTVNVPEVNINFHRINTKDTALVVDILGERQQHGQYQLQQISEIGEFVYSGRFELPAQANKRREFNIPISTIAELNKPGLYVAVMDIPGTYKNNSHTTYFMVTDLGIHVRRYQVGMDVYVNSIKSAEPIDDVKLQVVDYRGNILKSAVTKDGGHANYYHIKSSARYLIAQYQDSYSILPIKQAALDLSEFDLGKRPYQENELFIYSERDLYRPGDTVNFNALLRNFDGQLSRNTPLKAKLKQPTGQVAKEFSWKPSKKGFYEFTYTVDKNAKVGNWTLEVAGISKKKVTYQFKVEEFLPERLKLTFNPDNNVSQVFNTKQEINVPVLGEYLYGAPASGNRLDANIKVSLNPHPFEAYKKFNFGHIKETQWNDSFKHENEKMDIDGKKTLTIPSRWQSAKSPLAVNVFASLYESGGRPITRKHTAVVLPEKAIVGIRPLFNEYAPANGQAMFEIIKTDNSEKKLAASDLGITLIREDRRYYWEYNSHQGWHYEYTEKEFPEITSSSSIQSNATTTINLPVEYGQYRLEISDPETGYITSFKFRAGNNWYSWWRDNDSNGQSAKPDVVTLALDKENYKSGDTAILNIVPPSSGETIIVVEADKSLWSKRLHVPKEGKKIEIPISEKWNRHDIYISAVHIQAANQEKKITPTRSFGLTHLPLNRNNRTLKVEFDAPEKWLPNQSVDLNLNIFKDINNKKEAVKDAWVTLAAVDVGILNITNYKTPEPQKYFFEQRRYNPDSVDMYNKLIKLNDNPLAKQRWGGDASDVSRGGKQAQSEVQIVSLFSGLVSIKDGKANIPLNLPDFNGRLKLMAIAFTDDSFGNGEQEVIVAAPLVTQLSMPRFVAWGDTSTLALDINNLSGEKQTLNVSLTTSNPISQPQDTKQVVIDDKTKQTLLYPINIDGTDAQSDINLTIEGMDGYPIQRSWKLNARSAYPAITKNIKKVLKENESLSVPESEMADYIDGTIQASMSASNFVDLQIRSQLENLLHYPYGCLEQSTSSTYPWVFTNEKTLEQLELKNPTNKTPAQNVAAGIDRILKKQKSNGAFGLWSNTDKDEQHWLTAYAGDFLTDARQQGFDVPSNMYDTTMRKLGDYLRNSSSYATRWTEKPEHYQFAYRSYAAYVLSRHNKASLGHLRQLMDSTSHSQSLLPLIHLGIALHNQGDSENGNKILAQAFTKEARSSYYLGDYGSQIRDIALAIHLLTRHKLETDKVFDYSIELAGLLKERNYLSTQERNALYLAGLALQTGSNKQWEADIRFASAMQSIKHTGLMSKFHQGYELTNGIAITNRTDSPLYASVVYSGYQTKAPKSVDDKGISIKRRYYDTKGKALNPSSLTVGDLVLVAVDVATHKRMPDLMLVDLLPAGLELENQNLAHSASINDLTINNKPIEQYLSDTDIVHQEFRDDRYVAAINIGWNKRATVFYLARAVTPGTYLVPASYAEDMYDPERYAIGNTIPVITINQ